MDTSAAQTAFARVVVVVVVVVVLCACVVLLLLCFVLLLCCTVEYAEFCSERCPRVYGNRDCRYFQLRRDAR